MTSARPAGRAPGPVLEMTSDVLGAVRGAKTAAKRSMRSPVATLEVTDSAERIDALVSARDDLCQAGAVLALTTAVGDPAVTVVLADPPEPDQAR